MKKKSLEDGCSTKLHLICTKRSSNFVQNGGNITQTHLSLISWAGVYSCTNKSLTLCSSDFIFRKHMYDNDFHVSGVFQLTKTDPPITKNFPLLCLFLSAAITARRFYTPYDINYADLHILMVNGMSHIFYLNCQL